MTAIAKGWTATKDHGDGLPSVIEISLSEFEGQTHIHIDKDDGNDPGPSVWDEAQLGELLAGLIAAARQADYDMDTVADFAGLDLSA